MTGSFRVKRSGGPRTEKGKAVAAGNSLQTGIYATSVVMLNESEQEFLELRDSLLVELNAEGHLESALVHEIAVVTWKKLRLDGLESRCLRELLARPETPEEFYEAGFHKNESYDWALTHLDELTDEFIKSCRQSLLKAKSRPTIFQKGWATELKKQDPEKFDEYMDLDRQQQAKKDKAQGFSLQIVLNKAHEDPEQVSDEVEKRFESIVELIWLRERQKNEGAVFVGERLQEVQRLRDVNRPWKARHI